MRTDTLGRRIGRNPWRQLITSSQHAAREAWAITAEQVTRGYDTEMREYREQNPMPNLKHFMIGLSEGWNKKCQI